MKAILLVCILICSTFAHAGWSKNQDRAFLTLLNIGLPVEILRPRSGSENVKGLSNQCLYIGKIAVLAEIAVEQLLDLQSKGEIPHYPLSMVEFNAALGLAVFSCQDGDKGLFLEKRLDELAARYFDTIKEIQTTWL
jgi:hypothetical protein